MIERALFFILFMTCLGFAQEKNELGLLLGAEFIPNSATGSGGPLSLSKSITYSADYARQLSSANTVFFLEIPFAASPSHKVNGTQPNLITSLATLYATPSLQVRFANHDPVSPWISGGFGYGLYEGSRLLRNGLPNPQIYTSAATVQYGGGVNVRTPLKLLFPIRFRAEARDYYTQQTPSFGVSTQSPRQHNLVVAGGVVIRF